MPHRVSRHSLLLTLLILLPIPLLALLCRGHTPSRLDTPNLPFWERRLPHSLPPCHLYAMLPLVPGSIEMPDHSGRDHLLRADENRLLAGAEQMHRGMPVRRGSGWKQPAHGDAGIIPCAKSRTGLRRG